MSAPLKSIEGSGDIAAAMGEIGRRARAAARALALAPPDQKNRALGAMASAVRAQVSVILAANAEDVAEARAAARARRPMSPMAAAISPDPSILFSGALIFAKNP